jgi:hypothetical protein
MDNILFEVIPYPIKWDDIKKQNFVKKISEIIYKNNINIVNIPEVVIENRNPKRNISYLPKVSPLQFAIHLRNFYNQNYQRNIDFIINVVVPVKEKNYFLNYIDSLISNGINKIVLVGKDRSDKEYIGYEVVQAAKILKDKYKNEIILGGITIFHRKNEHLKIIEKRNSNIDFFISQIIFDKSNFYNLINTLKNLSVANLLNLKIYISLAVVNSFKELDFMKFLDVYFPNEILKDIKNIHSDKDLRTYFNRVLDSLIIELIELVFTYRRYNLDIGFNIEHIMYNNLDLSEELLKKVKIKLKNIEFLKMKNF